MSDQNSLGFIERAGAMRGSTGHAGGFDERRNRLDLVGGFRITHAIASLLARRVMKPLPTSGAAGLLPNPPPCPNPLPINPPSPLPPCITLPLSSSPQ
jgi:hypothetical protein